MSEQTRRRKTENIRENTRMPPYMMFPRFLLGLEMSETAKLLYMVLLDRGRLSAGNDSFTDGKGDSFVCYTVEELAGILGKERTCIHESLRTLEKEGLISRKRQGVGKANHIYVRLPVCPAAPGPAGQTDQSITGITSMCGKTAAGTEYRRQPENRPPDDRDFEGLMPGKPDRNKNNKNKNYISITLSDKETNAFGRYGNVLLTDEERKMLKEEVTDWQGYIERLSAYMASTGKEYRDHAATILLWAKKDKAVRDRQDYSHEEGESL